MTDQEKLEAVFHAFGVLQNEHDGKTLVAGGRRYVFTDIGDLCRVQMKHRGGWLTLSQSADME